MPQDSSVKELKSLAKKGHSGGKRQDFKSLFSLLIFQKQQFFNYDL